MAVDLRIIRDEIQAYDTGKGTIYFSDRWVKKFPEEARRYYGYIPRPYQRHKGKCVKVFYTEGGELVISGCTDPELTEKIRRYMEKWYSWKKMKYIRRWTFRYPVSILIRPYMSRIKDGFYQVRYGELFCNLDNAQLRGMNAMVSISTHDREVIEVETGHERLDIIALHLAKEIFDERSWPKLSEEDFVHFYCNDDITLRPCMFHRFSTDGHIDVWKMFQDEGLAYFDEKDQIR